MNYILLDYLFVGLISFIFGYITERIIYINNKNNLLTKTKKRNKYYFFLYLFLFGIILHFIYELIGINNWQCSKVCYNGVCNYVCVKKIEKK